MIKKIAIYSGITGIVFQLIGILHLYDISPIFEVFAEPTWTGWIILCGFTEPGMLPEALCAIMAVPMSITALVITAIFIIIGVTFGMIYKYFKK